MMETNCSNVILSEKFPSIISNKDHIIDIILNKLKDYEFTDKIDYDEFILLLDESITNAMEHGNQWDPSKLVNVEIMQMEDSISITIEDEGPGFDINTAYYKKRMSPNFGLRGRGIQIIKHFCKPLWNITGNKINLTIKIK